MTITQLLNLLFLSRTHTSQTIIMEERILSSFANLEVASLKLVRFYKNLLNIMINTVVIVSLLLRINLCKLLK